MIRGGWEVGQNMMLYYAGVGDESIPIITFKLSQNLLFRKEQITKPYLLKLGNWKAVAFLHFLIPLKTTQLSLTSLDIT